VVDVEDVIAAAQTLVEAGEADPARLAIRGVAAGAWTALAAVTTHAGKEPLFKAATSYSGITDLRDFAAKTHDFESHYADGLAGPLPGFQALYAERSPVGHITPETVPILLLQGQDNQIVLPAQARNIATQLNSHGIRYALLEFEGESHDFHRTETITTALEAELSFYAQTLGFAPPEVPPLKLINSPNPITPEPPPAAPPPSRPMPDPSLPAPRKPTATQQPSRA
jgi:dipeptidyl aminopeptidase/acylaminoacyl peptidase